MAGSEAETGSVFGWEVNLDLYDCHPAKVRSRETIINFIVELCDEVLEMKRFGEPWAERFSKQSRNYARYRPVYPAQSYDYLASLTPHHDRAWDVGTGNGQAAIGLARHYRSVIAADPSECQIALAMPDDHVTYHVATAEHSTLEDQSIDLIAVAQAVHWFDLDRFSAEVK